MDVCLQVSRGFSHSFVLRPGFCMYSTISVRLSNDVFAEFQVNSALVLSLPAQLGFFMAKPKKDPPSNVEHQGVSECA
jgi:hypothetical protein